MMNLIDEGGKRLDGRLFDQLRPFSMQAGLLKSASGSAYIEQGGNKILVGVYGPRDSRSRYGTNQDKAVLRCRYHMLPFSTEERKSPQPSRREIEISKVIRDALEPALLLEEFPRSVIDIYIEVLQSDGGSRGASITAASIALADAGIPMKDLVSAVAVGKVNGRLVLDLSDTEDKEGEVDLPIAVMLNSGLITLMQMDGKLSEDEFRQAIDLAMAGAKELREAQRKALVQKYFKEVDS